MADGNISLGSASATFNRYFLRYGPCTILTSSAIYFGTFKYCYPLFNANPMLNLIVAAILGLGIGYILTWPFLIFHIVRFSANEIYQLATIRNYRLARLVDVKNRPTRSDEVIDSYRHVREHGNAIGSFGLAGIQLLVIGSLFSLFDAKDNMTFDILYGIFSAITMIGFFAWYRGVVIESIELESIYAKQAVIEVPTKNIRSEKFICLCLSTSLLILIIFIFWGIKNYNNEKLDICKIQPSCECQVNKSNDVDCPSKTKTPVSVEDTPRSEIALNTH